jgi:hypothetical protein
MSAELNKTQQDKTKENIALRIVLNGDATSAYDSMADSLKGEEFVKFNPSRFVSFIVCQFFKLHFEKDKDLLISEFFDPKEFITGEMRKVKDPALMDQVLKSALDKLKKVQTNKKYSGFKSEKKSALPLNEE